MIPKHYVDNLLAFEEGGDSGARTIKKYLFSLHIPTLTICILQIATPPTVFIIERSPQIATPPTVFIIER